MRLAFNKIRNDFLNWLIKTERKPGESFFEHHKLQIAENTGEQISPKVLQTLSKSIYQEYSRDNFEGNKKR